MLNLQYVGDTTKYPVNFRKISEHIVQVTGRIPVKLNGFTLSRLVEDAWKADYSRYNTVYREIDGGIQFSNDGSVYVAPPIPEPEPEPEPYVPTLEDVKAMKLQEIGMACEQTIYAGVDVALPAGVEHFSLTEKDQINLFGKQAQMVAGAERFEYHQDGHPCRYYTKEEMQMVINTTFSFVTYHTTYCNALNIWVKELEDVDAVHAVVYGCEVPEEYQNEVFKDIVAQQADENMEA